jgi:hypothetical protein
MHLGIYEFRGDPEQLLLAYERMMASMPAGNTSWHLCARRDDGIVIYDTCPSEDAFIAFSSSPGLQQAFAAAGLPAPVITGIPVVSARAAGDVVSA